MTTLRFILLALILIAPCARVDAVGLPDALIRRISPGLITPFLGDNLYGADGTDQSVGASVARGRTAIFSVRVQNDGPEPDSFLLNVVGNHGHAIRVRVFEGTRDITDEAMAGTFTVANLAPSRSRSFKVKMIPTSYAIFGSTYDVLTTSTSTSDPAQKDVVKTSVFVRFPPAGKVTDVFADMSSGTPFIRFSITLGEGKRTSQSRSVLTETPGRYDSQGRPRRITGTLIYEYFDFPDDHFRMTATVAYRADGSPYGRLTVYGSTLRPSPQTKAF